MIKICYISAYSGRVNRGIESYTIGLITNLKKVNKNLRFDLISGGKVINENISNNYVYPISPRVLNGFWGGNFITDRLAIFGISPSNILSFICSISIFKILMSKKYNYYIPTNYIEILFCKLARELKKEKSKIIYVGHAGPGHDDFKALMLKPDLFVALTEPACNWAIKNSTSSIKVKLIPVGIDESVFNIKNTRSAKNPFDNKNKIALFMGALVPYKRPELAISTISKIKNLNLIVIGAGPLYEGLKSKHRGLINKSRLFFTGSVDHTAIPKYIKLCDFLIMTSTTRENCPAVLIESITMGKPVVATGYDRTKWIVGDAGVLSNSNNFKKSVNLLFKDYRKYKKACSTRAVLFSWENISKEWNKILI